MPSFAIRRTLAALLATSIAFPPQALAATRTWNGSVSTSGTVAANWTPAVVPTVADLMVFGLAMPYQVDLTSLPDTLGLILVEKAYPNLNVGRLQVADLEVGSLAGSASALGIIGHLLVSGAIEIASDATANAELVVGSGDSLTALASVTPLTVGSAGDGGLEVTNGGDVVANRRLSVGAGAVGTLGRILVEDPGSTMLVQPAGTPTNDFGVNGANGALDVLDGGRFELLGALYAGLTTGSTGTITVSSATADTSRLLATDFHLARNATAAAAGAASATVGARGLLQVTDELTTFDVNGGAGVLHVLGGGRVVTGSLTTSDPATQLDLQGGTLEVSGGVLDVGNSALAIDAAGDPLVRLSNGATATLVPATTPGLLVGGTAAGQFELESGANFEVVGKNIVFADSVNSIATASISTGARLATDFALVGGRNGSLAMDVRDGGLLDVTDLRLGTRAAGSAWLGVQGAGSLVTVSDRLELAGVGGAAGGSATLSVGDGGQVSLPNAAGGGDVWPNGRLSLEDGGTLSLAGDLNLRGGNLLIEGGVSAGGQVVMGAGAEIRGTGDLASSLQSTDTLSLVSTWLVPVAPSARAGRAHATGAALEPGTLFVGRADAPDGLAFLGVLDADARTLALRDADSAVVRRVVLDGGEVHAPAGGMAVVADGRITGSGRIVGDVALQGTTVAEGPQGLTFAGRVSGAALALNGTRHAFAAGSLLEADGVIATDVDVDSGAVVVSTDSLTLGTSLSPTRVVVNGRVETGGHVVVFDGTDTTKVRGTLDLAGGVIAADQPIVVEPEGTLTGDGEVLARVLLGGTLSPGPSTDTLRVGLLVCLPTAITTIELGNHAAGEWDRVEAILGAAPGGTLDLRTLPGFAAQPGDTFQILATPLQVSAFANVTLNGGPVAPYFQVVSSTSGTVLIAQPGVLDAPAPIAGGGAPPALRFAAHGSPGHDPALALSLPAAARVQVELLDVSGRRLATLCDADLAAGTHRFERLGRLGVPAGLTFARARVSGGGATRELVTRLVRLR